MRNQFQEAPPAIERRQQRTEFVCSACGADRGCDCNAPALARAEKVLAAAEQRRVKDRDRKREERAVRGRAAENAEELPALSVVDGENADEPEKRQDRAIGMVQADAGKAAAPSKAEPPPTSSERSWRVELTTDNGTRLVNGARFKTKVEAALYAFRNAEDMLSPLWRPILRKAGHKPRIIVMTRVLGSADAANCDMRLPKGRLGEANVDFQHGKCHLLLDWHPEDETEPSYPAAAAATDPAPTDPAPAKPSPGTGNGSDPEQSAAKRRAEFAALAGDDGADPDDGLDIPSYLRREPKAVSS